MFVGLEDGANYVDEKVEEERSFDSDAVVLEMMSVEKTKFVAAL